jgi:hypothetical protein
MRILVFLLLTSLSNFAFSQKTKKQLHMKDVECDYDTTAYIYTDVNMRVMDEESKNIVFEEGNQKILSIKCFSVKCDCSDCFESNELAINIDSLKMNEVHYFKSSEVIWVYKNSWVKPKYITTYLGNITMKDKNRYELKISELLGATVIRSINLNVKVD